MAHVIEQLLSEEERALVLAHESSLVVLRHSKELLATLNLAVTRIISSMAHLENDSIQSNDDDGNDDGLIEDHLAQDFSFASNQELKDTLASLRALSRSNCNLVTTTRFSLLSESIQVLAYYSRCADDWLERAASLVPQRSTRKAFKSVSFCSKRDLNAAMKAPILKIVSIAHPLYDIVRDSNECILKLRSFLQSDNLFITDMEMKMNENELDNGAMYSKSKVLWQIQTNIDLIPVEMPEKKVISWLASLFEWNRLVPMFPAVTTSSSEGTAAATADAKAAAASSSEAKEAASEDDNFDILMTSFDAVSRMLEAEKLLHSIPAEVNAYLSKIGICIDFKCNKFEFCEGCLSIFPESIRKLKRLQEQRNCTLEWAHTVKRLLSTYENGDVSALEALRRLQASYDDLLIIPDGALRRSLDRALQHHQQQSITAANEVEVSKPKKRKASESNKHETDPDFKCSKFAGQDLDRYSQVRDVEVSNSDSNNNSKPLKSGAVKGTSKRSGAAKEIVVDSQSQLKKSKASSIVITHTFNVRKCANQSCDRPAALKAFYCSEACASALASLLVRDGIHLR
jgi:hypothetical protein